MVQDRKTGQFVLDAGHEALKGSFGSNVSFMCEKYINSHYRSNQGIQHRTIVIHL